MTSKEAELLALAERYEKFGVQSLVSREEIKTIVAALRLASTGPGREEPVAWLMDMGNFLSTTPYKDVAENWMKSGNVVQPLYAHSAPEGLGSAGEMREILNRFAKRADDHSPHARDDTIVHFRLRDCRAAKAALSAKPAPAAVGEVREAIAAALKRDGFTSRDGTIINAGTYGVIDAILALSSLPAGGEASANDFQAAAEALSKILLVRNARREDFSIGIGVDRLHLYARCTEGQWRLPKPSKVNGALVEWHFGVGPTIACSLPPRNVTDSEALSSGGLDQMKGGGT
jgi:hypothetical protein